MILTEIIGIVIVRVSHEEGLCRTGDKVGKFCSVNGAVNEGIRGEREFGEKTSMLEFEGEAS